MDDNASIGHTTTTAAAAATATTTTTVSIATTNRGFRAAAFDSNGSGEHEADEDTEAFSGEVWGTFTDNFRQVQSVLDRNRVLIQQVNENHQSKIHDNLVRNVALIQEINGNISKVVSLYSDLSANFSSMFHQQNGAVDAKSNSSEGT